MPVQLTNSILNQLINRFYAAYDPARQFEEASDLYQSVVAGEREAVDVMNAIYATYPSALSNLYCQALWRYAPSEMPANHEVAQTSLPAPKTWSGVMEHLQQRFNNMNIDVQLLPSVNETERRSILLRETMLAYDSERKSSDTWTSANALELIATIEEETGKNLREAEEDQFFPAVDRYFTLKATEEQKQRAALWKVLWEADILDLESVNSRIEQCEGNAVSATIKCKEQLRANIVRLEEQLHAPPPSAQTSETSAAAATTDSSNNNNSNVGPSSEPIPGSEVRSSSAQDKKSIEHLRGVLEKGTAAVEAQEKRLREREQELASQHSTNVEQHTSPSESDLARFATIRDELNEREKDLQEVQRECQTAALRLNERQLQLESWEKALSMRESDLQARQGALLSKEEQHLVDAQKTAESLQVASAAVTRREQMVEVKEHVIGQREAEVRRREEALLERETSTERRAEAITQRSLELERHLAELELRSLRVRTREAGIWKSYINQQLAAADSSPDHLGASLGVIASDLKGVRGHLERLGTVAATLSNPNESTNTTTTTTEQKDKTQPPLPPTTSSSAATGGGVHDKSINLSNQSSSNNFTSQPSFSAASATFGSGGPEQSSVMFLTPQQQQAFQQYMQQHQQQQQHQQHQDNSNPNLSFASNQNASGLFGLQQSQSTFLPPVPNNSIVGVPATSSLYASGEGGNANNNTAALVAMLNQNQVKQQQQQQPTPLGMNENSSSSANNSNANASSPPPPASVPTTTSS